MVSHDTVTWSQEIAAHRFPAVSNRWRRATAANTPAPLYDLGHGTMVICHLAKERTINPGNVRRDLARIYAPAIRHGDYIVNYYWDWTAKRWNGPVTVDGVGGITGKIACLQNDIGNYVLFAQQGNQLVHYERNNNDPNAVYPNYPWAHTSTVPIPRGYTTPEIAGFSVFQSVAFRDKQGSGFLELVVHFSQAPQGVEIGRPAGTFDYLVTYYFDYSTESWQAQSSSLSHTLVVMAAAPRPTGGHQERDRCPDHEGHDSDEQMLHDPILAVS